MHRLSLDSVVHVGAETERNERHRCMAGTTEPTNKEEGRENYVRKLKCIKHC